MAENLGDMTLFRVCGADVCEVAGDMEIPEEKITADVLSRVRDYMSYGLESWDDVIRIALNEMFGGSGPGKYKVLLCNPKTKERSDGVFEWPFETEEEAKEKVGELREEGLPAFYEKLKKTDIR